MADRRRAALLPCSTEGVVRDVFDLVAGCIGNYASASLVVGVIEADYITGLFSDAGVTRKDEFGASTVGALKELVDIDGGVAGGAFLYP